MKKLNLTLAEQLENPATDLVKLAEELRCKTPDETIINILKWVVNNIAYVPDYNNWGKLDYWADAYTVYLNRKDDCDGQNSLIYILARLAGISELQLFSAIGDVYDKQQNKSFGHYWVIYFSTKTEKFHAIDACVYPDFTSIKNRKMIDIQVYTDIWYIFNEAVIYKHR